MHLFRTRPNAISKQAGAYTTDRRDHNKSNLFATNLAIAKQRTTYFKSSTVTLNPLIIYQSRWKHFIGAGQPAVPATLVRKITALEFIDMEDFSPREFRQTIRERKHHELPPKEEQGLYPLL